MKLLREYLVVGKSTAYSTHATIAEAKAAIVWRHARAENAEPLYGVFSVYEGRIVHTHDNYPQQVSA
jgi:hypothetical protein